MGQIKNKIKVNRYRAQKESPDDLVSLKTEDVNKVEKPHLMPKGRKTPTDQITRPMKGFKWPITQASINDPVSEQIISNTDPGDYAASLSPTIIAKGNTINRKLKKKQVAENRVRPAKQSKIKHEIKERLMETAFPDVISDIEYVTKMLHKVFEELKVDDSEIKKIAPLRDKKKRKYLGSRRGRTATGKPAHAIEISPLIKSDITQNKTTPSNKASG